MANDFQTLKIKVCQLLSAKKWQATSKNCGIVTSHFYYLKGKKEGEAAGYEYRKQLVAANKKIAELQSLLNKSNFSTSTILKKSFEHDLETNDIKEILLAGKKYNENEPEILNEFDLLFNQNKQREAKNFFNGIKDKLTNIALKNYMAGRICSIDGKPDEALEHFSLCLLHDKEPNNRKMIHCLMANIYFLDKSQPQFALKEMGAAYNLDKSDPAVLVNMGIFYMALGEEKMAEEKLKEAIAADPAYPDSYFELGQLYIRQNNPLEAIKKCKAALACGAVTEMVYRIMGDAFCTLTEYDEALNYYAKAMEVCTHAEMKEEIMVAQIRTYKAKGDWVAAESLANRTYQDYPNNLQLLGIYFDLLNDMGKPEKVLCLSLPLNLRIINEDSSIINYNMGRAFLLMQQHELAREKFELVLSHNPLNPANLHQLAEYYRTKSNPDFEKVRELRVRVNEISGNHPDTLNWLGTAYLDLMDFDKAIACFNEVLKIAPNHPYAGQNRSFASNRKLSTQNKLR